MLPHSLPTRLEKEIGEREQDAATEHHKTTFIIIQNTYPIDAAADKAAHPRNCRATNTAPNRPQRRSPKRALSYTG
jgi:hypothetical protein